MAVKFEDYYQTLGVSREASQDEIQKAYRKLARKYHPDVNKEASAKGRFEKLTEAYEVLKDPEKRKKYDQLGANWKQGQDFRPPPGAEGFEFRNTGPGGFAGGPSGFSDFFESLFGGRGGGNGMGGFEDLFSQAHTGRSAQHQEQEAQIRVGFDEAYHGATRRLTLQGPQGQKTVEVKIPPGTAPGSKLRLRREGLVLKVDVAEHPRYKLEGKDISVELPLRPDQAALGDRVPVDTPEGEVTLTIPPGTSSGSRLRLSGKGLPGRGKQSAGDLYVQVKITVPRKLTDAQRAAYEQLRSVSE